MERREKGNVKWEPILAWRSNTETQFPSSSEWEKRRERLKNYFEKYLCLFRQFSLLVPSSRSLAHSVSDEIVIWISSHKTENHWYILVHSSCFLIRSNMFCLLPVLVLDVRFDAWDKKPSWLVFLVVFRNGEKILCNIYIHSAFYDGKISMRTRETLAFPCHLQKLLCLLCCVW